MGSLLEVVPGGARAAKQPPSDEDKALLTKLTKSGTVVDVAISDDISPEEYHNCLRVVSIQLTRSLKQAEVLMPFLGRLLDITSRHPELYKDKGFDSYETFVEMLGAKYGVGRSTCFEARRMVQRFPSLTISEFEKTGRVNMRILAQAIPKGEEQKPFARKLVEMAQTSTAKDLRAHCEEKGYLHKGETQGAYISIGCSADVKAAWDEFVNNVDVHAFVENASPGAILHRMIEECSGEWLARVEDARDGEADEG